MSTPAQRRQAASIAANTRWSRTPDRRAKAARVGIDFEKRVDPDGQLDPAVRARLADNARRAYFQRLSAAGVRARQRTT